MLCSSALPKVEDQVDGSFQHLAEGSTSELTLTWFITRRRSLRCRKMNDLKQLLSPGNVFRSSVGKNVLEKNA